MMLFGRFCKLIEPGLVGLLLFPLLDIFLCLLHPLSIFFSEGFEGSWFMRTVKVQYFGLFIHILNRCEQTHQLNAWVGLA